MGLTPNTERLVWQTPYYTDQTPKKETPEDYYPSCVGKGWLPLLLKLTDQLHYLGWSGGLNQVKEKFGTLRFYWQNDIPDEVLAEAGEALVQAAEWKSGYTCEVCGTYGDLDNSVGWVLTLCTEHKRLRKEDKAAFHKSWKS